MSGLFTTDGERPIRVLGEIALRVTDLDTMQRLYEYVVGLELMRRTEDAAFFKIADSYGATCRSSPSSTGLPLPDTGARHRHVHGRPHRLRDQPG